MMHLVPGDPIDFMFQGRTLTSEDRALIRERLGLDDPLPVQYLRFLGNAVQGDLGKAIFVQRPVTRIILDELPFTLRLALGGMTLTVLFGLIFGVLAALFHNSWLDSLIMAVALSGLSVPNFWLGLMLTYIFCAKLNLLPILGDESLAVLILPSFVIGFRASATISRLTRSGLLEVLNQDYIRTARAKGLTERAVVVRHALKNALIPVVTYLGLQFGQLLGGAVVVETVFARRGIGSLTVNAILQRDLPLAQGTVLFVALAYVLTNLSVDVLYAYIDPRIRYN
jgi:ABC-type dipeptide/oligopeptide/nickel transport system permease component